MAKAIVRKNNKGKFTEQNFYHSYGVKKSYEKTENAGETPAIPGNDGEKSAIAGRLQERGRFISGTNLSPVSGMTLTELIIAGALALIVLSAVFALFVSGLNVEAHLEGELARNRAIGTIMKEMGVDIRETSLEYATTGQDEDMAVSFPVARDLKTGRFITDEKNCYPQWKKLRIYYIPSDNKQLMRMDLVPKDEDLFDPNSKKFDLPIKEDDLHRYITVKDSYAEKYKLISRIKVSGNIDSFKPGIIKTEYTDAVGEKYHRYYLDLSIELFYKERGKEELKKAVITRKIFSDNSMFPRTQEIPPTPPIPTPDLTPYFDS